MQPPGLPIDVTAEAGVREAHVAWTAPEPKRGAPVHAYTVRASPGDIAVTVPGKATRATVPGLANGTMYTFTVQASNPVGEGPMSVPSQPITTPDLPDAVKILTVSVEATRATLTWRPPGYDGGSPLTANVITAQPGDVQVSVAGNATTATLEGLASATRYTFTIQARNAVGDGPRSDAWVTSTLCGAVSLVD
ncbi:fibronectin type III domain-containing protein, partial [Pyxidicoccus fallax]|nr:fibronectin type III domain-containing protein [Pyxidicoccus fallax]NPC85202.1 fibronectin type III domain-containing protein [Pyxidicoccus fallax]